MVSRLFSPFVSSSKKHQVKKAKAHELKDVQEEGDVVDDQPRELPIEMWGSSLQSLYVNGNRLKWLPDYLGNFSTLARLDISG